MKDAGKKPKTHRITATVKNIRGTCPIYKPNDKLVFEGFYLLSHQSSPVCIHALSAMNTLLSPFLHGVGADELGIGSSPDIGYLQCPDPGPPYTSGGTVTFELKRMELRPRRLKS
ncbi:MAG: TIGR04076 family protein [Nitrososphaeria archaeon]